MESICYSKKLEIKYNPDVFIAGGGPAGIAAAVSCGRNGKSVFIAEGFSSFGGAAVTMLVPAFMPFGDNDHFYAQGIGEEIRNKISERIDEKWAKYCPDSIPVETLKLIYDDMINESGAEYLFHCNVIDAVTENGEIQYVICSAKGSVFAVKAKVYIDCTGDADLSYYAGAQTEYGDENGLTMAATLCGIWSGIDFSRVLAFDGRNLDKAFEDGVFTNEDRHLPGMWRLRDQSEDNFGNSLCDGIGGSNAGHVYNVDARYSESLTKAIMKGRKQLPEYKKYYSEYLEGFENLQLVASAPYIGIRESRRVVCDYRLVLDDFKNQAVFDDEIGRYNYCVDIHSPTNDKEGYEKFIKDHTSLRYKSGESYGIPYRTLAVKGLDNLLVAGRCICSDRYMQSSVRVMPGCFITGQAAGIAAAVICENEGETVHTVNVKEVQSRLADMGAYIPNFKKQGGDEL